MAAGRGAIGVDASALAVAIARVRSTLLGGEERERLVAEAARIAEESSERARKRRRPEVPPWADQEIQRFHAHVLFELLGLRELVFATKEDQVGWALRLCLSSILVKFMKAGPEAPRDGEAKRIARGIPSRMLADRAVELARGLGSLERRMPAGTPAPEVHEADARALPIPDRERGPGPLVAALRRDLRLRRAARDALRLAGAVVAEVPEGPDGRARLGHR